jgi:hypothetical protein
VPGLRRLGRSAPGLPCEAIEMLCGLGIKSTERLLLDAPAEKPRHDVLGKVRWRGGLERRAPQGAKFVEAERPHADDLGFDCLAISSWAKHAGHAALRPDLALRFGTTSFASMR